MCHTFIRNFILCQAENTTHMTHVLDDSRVEYFDLVRPRTSRRGKCYLHLPLCYNDLTPWKSAIESLSQWFFVKIWKIMPGPFKSKSYLDFHKKKLVANSFFISSINTHSYSSGLRYVTTCMDILKVSISRM